MSTKQSKDNLKSQKGSADKQSGNKGSVQQQSNKGGSQQSGTAGSGSRQGEQRDQERNISRQPGQSNPGRKLDDMPE